MQSRREFLANALKAGALFAVPAVTLDLFGVRKSLAEATQGGKKKVRWGMLVDTQKCVGCGMCVRGCKLENDVPYDVAVSRTWVERYVVSSDGKVMADTPNAARDGFTSEKVQWGKEEGETVKPESVQKAFFVPKLCNQCENPPCVQVCPVGATYQAENGIVLIDRSWCIGCGYCVMACPYGARFFHPKYNVAEKCTFCTHRLDKGLKPACVEACAFDARQIANLADPEDPVTKRINTERTNVLKEEYGTKPQVFYVGMTKEVR